MKSGARKILTMALCLLLLVPVLASCADGEVRSPSASHIYNATPTPARLFSGTDDEEGDTDAGLFYSPRPLSGTLRIGAVSEDLYNYSSLAAGFMALYPDVSIEFDCEFAAGEGTRLPEEEYEARAAGYPQQQYEQLAGVHPPDLIIPAFNLAWAAGQGFLCDMNTFMDDDSEFKREDYFENVFEQKEWEGELLSFPTSVFIFYGVQFNTRVTEALGIDIDLYRSVTPMDILEIYCAALDAGVAGEDFFLQFGDGGKQGLWLYEVESFLQTEQRTASFDSSECIAFLEASQRIQTKKTGFQHSPIIFNAMKKLAVSNDALINIERMRCSFEWIDSLFGVDHASKMLPLVTRQGEHLWYCTELAIPENSQNKELAWEFIKYCIWESETVAHSQFEQKNLGRIDGDRWFLNAVPMNRNNCQKYIAQLSEEAEADYSAEYALIADWMDNLKGDINGRSLGLSYSDFSDILTEFYDLRSIAADQCAEKMQERAEAYFAELAHGE